MTTKRAKQMLNFDISIFANIFLVLTRHESWSPNADKMWFHVRSHYSDIWPAHDRHAPTDRRAERLSRLVLRTRPVLWILLSVNLLFSHSEEGEHERNELLVNKLIYSKPVRSTNNSTK